MATVTGLFVYPVKGLRAVSVTSVRFTKYGLDGDRGFMLVDESGKFISQRSDPRLATAAATLDGENLSLFTPFKSFVLNTHALSTPREVRIWRSRLIALGGCEEVDRALSEFLGKKVGLVKIPPGDVRKVSPDYSDEGDYLRFQDGFPILMTNEASLEAVNAEMGTAVPMDRFRPNVVVSGIAAWEEEQAAVWMMNGVRFKNAKPCGRCSVTTIDQLSGELTGDEPLRTLKAMRPEGNTVDFGANLIPLGAGAVSLGDHVWPETMPEKD